jgi:hypothetical protein
LRELFLQCQEVIMNNGMYLGEDLTIHRREGYNAALDYLYAKKTRRLQRRGRIMAAIFAAMWAWAVVMLLTWRW